MKVLLMVPPQFDVTMPSLALPSLAAMLREAGHQVLLKDVNLEAFDTLLSREEISNAYFHLCMHRKDLLFSGADPDEIQRMIAIGIHLADKVEAAKSTLRDSEAFYRFESYKENMGILQQCLRLLSLVHYPEKITFYTYTSGYNSASTKEIMEAVQDEDSNLFNDFYRKNTLPYILEEKPAVIGISISCESQVIQGLTLAYMVKKELQGVHVVIGGSFFTRLTEEVKQNRSLFSIIDSMIVNEGETALVQLVRCVEDGMDLETVPNLIYRHGDEILSNKLDYVESLKLLPTPDFDGLPLDLYFSPHRMLPVYSTRGCYWGRCAFCSFYLTGGSRFRYRGMDRVLEDMKKLSKKYGCRHFTFIDEAIPPKYLSHLAEGLLNKKMEFFWFAHARFEKQFDAVLFERLSKSGCTAVAFGLESACDRVLQIMDKGTDAETIARVLKDSRNAGIANHISFFVGFPTETPQESEKTISFIMEQTPNIDSVSFESFHLMKDSRVHKDLERFSVTGIRRGINSDLAMEFEYTVSTGLSREEAESIKQKVFPMLWNRFRSFQMTGCHEAFHYAHFKGEA